VRDELELVETRVAKGSGFPADVMGLFTADPEDVASRPQERKVLRQYTLRAMENMDGPLALLHEIHALLGIASTRDAHPA